MQRRRLDRQTVEIIMLWHRTRISNTKIKSFMEEGQQPKFLEDGSYKTEDILDQNGDKRYIKISTPTVSKYRQMVRFQPILIKETPNTAKLDKDTLEKISFILNKFVNRIANNPLSVTTGEASLLNNIKRELTNQQVGIKEEKIKKRAIDMMSRFQ